MQTLRRYLVLIALMFWLGGFTFYASIVVPVGTRVLGSSREQANITREVTRRLNTSAGLALMILAWDVLATADPSRLQRLGRGGMWLVMVVCQVLLFFLHAHLDRIMQLEEAGLDGRAFRAAFRPSHRIYLWTHTVQWFAGLFYMGMMLRGWRSEDQRQGKVGNDGEAQKSSATD